MQGLEDFAGAERVGDAVPFEIFAQICADAAHDDIDPLFLQFRNQIVHGAPGGKINVGDRAGVDHEMAHGSRRGGDQVARLVGEAIGIGVEQVGAEAIDDQARRRFKTGLSRDRPPAA